MPVNYSSTFRIENFDNDQIKPKWDNKGKELTQGIDDNEEPATCNKGDLKW